MDVRVQVDAARRASLAVPSGDLATLVVTGKDRVSWLNGLVTCDLVKRADGEARYGLVVARNGRVISDATVVIDDADARALVVVPAELVEKLRAHLDHYLVMEDAEVAADTGAFEPWMLHGPRSGDVLAVARAAGAVGGDVDATGLGGAIALAPTTHAREVRAAIERAVHDAGGVVGDAGGWEALRLERAVPRFGADFDEKTYPQEASLEKTAVSFDKGCYLGQEVVCMLELRGHVKRKLVPVIIDASVPPPQGSSVTDQDGAPVGEITSAAASPTLGKPVALAMLKRAVAEPGKRVFVAGASGRVVERF
jgi:folate-binding protein YgfZ